MTVKTLKTIGASHLKNEVMMKDTAKKFLAEAVWDPEACAISYTLGDGTKAHLKVYAYPGGTPQVYIPTAGLMSYARALWYVIHQEECEVVTFEGEPIPKNLRSMTRSEQARQAALNKSNATGRLLPHNIYALSSGWYVGRRGSRRTANCRTVEEAQALVEGEVWL